MNTLIIGNFLEGCIINFVASKRVVIFSDDSFYFIG